MYLAPLVMYMRHFRTSIFKRPTVVSDSLVSCNCRTSSNKSKQVEPRTRSKIRRTCSWFSTSLWLYVPSKHWSTCKSLHRYSRACFKYYMSCEPIWSWIWWKLSAIYLLSAIIYKNSSFVKTNGAPSGVISIKSYSMLWMPMWKSRSKSPRLSTSPCKKNVLTSCYREEISLLVRNPSWFSTVCTRSGPCSESHYASVLRKASQVMHVPSRRFGSPAACA